MRKVIPNQVFNQPDIPGKTIYSMTRRVLVMLVLLLSFAGAQAQTGQLTAPASQSSIMHLDQFLASLRQEQGRGTQSPAVRVESLINDLNPSLYVKSGEVNSYGTAQPVVLYTDPASLATVQTLSAAQKATVELVNIRLTGAMKGRLNLAAFSSFPNLKYIYIMSPTATTPAAMSNMVENTNPNQQVFYSIHQIN